MRRSGSRASRRSISATRRRSPRINTEPRIEMSLAGNSAHASGGSSVHRDTPSVGRLRSVGPGSIALAKTEPSSIVSLKSNEPSGADDSAMPPVQTRLIGGVWSTAGILLVIILTLHGLAELWSLSGGAAAAPDWIAAVHASVYAALPVRLLPVAAQRVLWCAWVTDACTGAGALPFLFTRGGLSTRWVAAANAAAGGMMLAASALLVVEAAGFVIPSQPPLVPDAGGGGGGGLGGAALLFAHWLGSLPSALHMAAGVAAGVGFVRSSQQLLHSYEDLKFSGFAGADAQRMLLILAVMTVHSLAEGIGLGVSFGSSSGEGGAQGQQQGQGHGFGLFISAALAMHNVPEGLAICIVLVPRGVPVAEAALWAVLTSLPQPLMALPAFLSVQSFALALPAGLGFAAGAMAWVAATELLVEAVEGVGKRRAAICAAAAALPMVALHVLARD